MPRDLVRLCFLSTLFAMGGCSLLVDSALSSKDDGGTPTDSGSDAARDSGPDTGPVDGSTDSGPACTPACGLHSTCNAATHLCACDMGYADMAGTCVDVNECTAHADDCAMNALCENTPGSFLCHCFPGASGDGRTCTPPTVLILTDTMAMTAVENGAMRAGTTPTVTTDAAAFTSMLTGGTWSAIFVTSISAPSLDTATVDAIDAYVAGGGKAVMSHYEIDTFPTLENTFEVTGTPYMGAEDVATDLTTTPDLFTQQEIFPTPLSMHGTSFFTEGVRLAPFGSAFAVASLSGGGSAIVIGNHGRTIVNGFTIAEGLATVAPDVDGDGLFDASELVTNELDYLLRPHVLVYFDGGDSARTASRAVGGLRWSQFLVGNGLDFDRVYARGGFDVIFVDCSSNFFSATNQTDVSAWSATIGKTIFSYWDLDGDGMDTTVLRTALAVTTTSFATDRHVFDEPATPTDFFTFRDTFTSPLSTSPAFFGDHGDELTPTDTATSFVAAHFDSATGPGAIAVTHGTRTIVDGFLSGDYSTVDNDGDSTPDVQELFSNELLYLMTRP